MDDTLQVYLIDFGLARLNHQAIAISSIAAGTPGFMPPEELFNRPLGASADLYSVGATLISVLTQTPSAQISNLIDDTYRLNFKSQLPPINPSFTEWLQTMVEPNPRDRFSNAATALEALRAIDISDLSPQPTDAASAPGGIFNRPISRRTAALSIWTVLLGVSLAARFFKPAPPPQITPYQIIPTPTLTPEQRWFEAIKPQCNSLEVMTALRQNPYPDTLAGAGFGASCYALAGKLSRADQIIQSLSPLSQTYAAKILFDIGHPVADQGDDESSGPIMDLVLKYWPENYMARYHAGMSAYVLADNDKAIAHLEEFLHTYQPNDGWRQRAMLALDNIEKGIPADDRFKFHH